MANRFIDTGFFRSPYVRSLEAPYKTLYAFIVTDCSGSGIWTVDIPIACIYIGAEINFSDAKKIFIDSGKAIDLGNGKWFFPDFIEHQYPKGLQEKNPAHFNIIFELKKYNLIDENLKVLKAPDKGLERPLQGSKVMVMDKVMDKDKVMVINKTRAKKNDAEKKPVIENVLLSEEEILKAKEKFGDKFQWAIETLSNYKFSSGKKYKSDYHALIGWVYEKYLSAKSAKSTEAAPQKSYTEKLVETFTESERLIKQKYGLE